MESIIRNDGRPKITLADFYANIDKGKECPEFYRDANLLIGSGEEEPDGCLILETLGKGGIGFVFLAFFQRKLTAVKMTYETQKDEHIFSTVKKVIGDEYRDYFLTPRGETVKINSFYLGKLKEENKHFFDREITVTLWEPADAMLSEKLDETFENKLKWFRQFLNGLRIIHSRDRAHFDIKLDNLFLVGNRLKIGDFEFYYKIEDFKKSDFLIGTAGHIAPEMFVDREHISTKVDIFSAGIAFAQLFTGQSAADIKNAATKVPAGHPLSTKGHEEPGLKKIFLENHRIYEFFKGLVEDRLASSTLPLKEKSVFRLLLWMMEISPDKRPDVELLLKEINVISSGSDLETGKTAESIAEEISTEKYEIDAFSRLLQTNFLKGICIFTWGILFLIVASPVLAKISLVQIPFFVKALKYLSWIFWGLICFSLPFLIYYQRKFAREKMVEISTRGENTWGADYFRLYFKYFSGEPSSVILTIIFIIASLLIIFESFQLIKPVIYMWIPIIVLSPVAISSKITPGDKVIKTHITFITVLSSSILIFAIFALSDPFHKSFLTGTEWIDKTIFANAAVKVGPPDTPLMEHKIAKIHSPGIQEPSIQSYLNTFKMYIEKLGEKSLEKTLLPHKSFNNGPSVHAGFIKKALAAFEDDSVSRQDKGKIMDTLLDYLVIIINRQHIAKLNNDPDYPIKGRFLQELADLIETENLGNIPSIRLRLKELYCALKMKTTINPLVIKKFLGEEVEPCSQGYH